MPSYLCPTILNHFKNKKIKVIFYKINNDLSIDLENLKDLLRKFYVKAIFFIDYFGFYHNDETLSFLEKSRKDRIIIEDAVQMLWINHKKNFIGDYVFNSYRVL